MKSSLIGFTGFVGSNLAKQADFDDGYRSTTIDEIRGKSYDLIVCAGAPAEKWKANKFPVEDKANLSKLTDALKTVKARQAVLISTVDVYPNAVGVDENTIPDAAASSAYGKHRRELEEFFAAHFPTLIVRLPGLFGPGLKKNVIYDLLHKNRLEAIHAEGQFQYYGLARLWSDVQKAIAHKLSVVNLTSEPVQVHEVAKAAFAMDFSNRPAQCPAPYNVRSLHAELFGGKNGYLRSKTEILSDLKAFVSGDRRETA